MFKADVNDKYTKLEIVGDLKDICTDLTHILSAINERLSEKRCTNWAYVPCNVYKRIYGWHLL